MRNDDGSRPTWRFFDGAVSISISMLLALLLSDCNGCHDLPALGYLTSLTGRDNGTIIVGTLLLFPTSMAFYGGMIVFFAARETVKAWAEKREMKQRKQERERIQREFAARGVPLTPEQEQILFRETDNDQSG